MIRFVAPLALIFSAMLVAAIGVPACHVFDGPLTQEYACPVLCGSYDGKNVCCSAHQECTLTGWPDRPCRDVMLARASAKDASPE